MKSWKKHFQAHFFTPPSSDYVNIKKINEQWYMRLPQVEEMLTGYCIYLLAQQPHERLPFCLPSCGKNISAGKQSIHGGRLGWWRIAHPSSVVSLPS